MTQQPDPAPQRAPRGVPRWPWPPAGASVRRVVLRECRLALDPQPFFEVVEGGPVEDQHLRALTWLLDDYAADAALAEGDFDAVVVLEIARTDLPYGRVGHAYALDGGPLGAPSAAVARGLVLRFAAYALGP